MLDSSPDSVASSVSDSAAAASAVVEDFPVAASEEADLILTSEIFSAHSSAEASGEAADRRTPMLREEARMFRRESRFRLRMPQRAVREPLISTVSIPARAAAVRAQRQAQAQRPAPNAEAEAM